MCTVSQSGASRFRDGVETPYPLLGSVPATFLFSAALIAVQHHRVVMDSLHEAPGMSCILVLGRIPNFASREIKSVNAYETNAQAGPFSFRADFSVECVGLIGSPQTAPPTKRPISSPPKSSDCFPSNEGLVPGADIELTYLFVSIYRLLRLFGLG